MNKQHKDIYLDSETKKNWDNPTGYMDGGYSNIYGQRLRTGFGRDN